MGKKRTATQKKGFQEVYEAFKGKIDAALASYKNVKDILHLAKKMAADEEIVALAKKIKNSPDKELYVLLAAEILRVFKEELEDGDGILDIEEK